MTLTTRTTLMTRIVPPLGGYSGSITSGTAGTAVLGGLVGITSDDDFNDWLLYMPDASAAGDQARIVTDWAGTTGTASFAARVTDTSLADETYLLVPKGSWTLTEIRDAINKALRESRRSTRFVVPTRNYTRMYQLDGLTWLRSARDVDAVFDRPSPNLLDNEDFARWQNGTALAPDSWTLSGSGATIARGSTFPSYGAYTAQVTRVTNDATLYQDLPYGLAKQLIDDLAAVAVEVRCTATVASRVRVGINDGNDTTWSSYHSGDGEPEDLTATRTLTAAASRVRVSLSVDTGDTMGDFDAAFLVEGTSVPEALTNAGSEGYRERQIANHRLNVGSGVPTVLLPNMRGRGAQLVISSRRPWATLSTDVGTTEAPSDLIESRAIYELAAMFKPGVDRKRMEALMALHGSKFADLARQQFDKPVPSFGSAVVRGA